jgi:hypothetical protein
MKIDPNCIDEWCMTDNMADYLFGIEDLPFKIAKSPYLSLYIYNKYKKLITPNYNILTKYNIQWLNISNIYQDIHNASMYHDYDSNTYIGEVACLGLPLDFYDKYLYLLPFLGDIPVSVYVKYNIKCMFDKMV